MSRRQRALALTAITLLASLALPLTALAAHLNLDVELDPQTRRFEAVAELVAPADFTFALHESLAVSTATVDGRAARASASAHGKQRVWRLSAPKGGTVRIVYGGTLPDLDRRLDHRDVLRTLEPMASNDGTYLPAGSGWYPQPRGPFSYTLRLSLPAAQRGLVPGRLAAETVPGAAHDRYVARFEFAPSAEGIDLMAGPYVVREKRVTRDGAEALVLRTYFYSDLDDALAEDYLGDTARYIELYSKTIGAYPFAGFSIVASPLPTGFGMPGLTYMGAQVLKLPFIRASSLGHEILHNWWGNGVYVDYAGGNWSEGLTTFMADYHYRERESAAAAREMRLAWLRDLAAVPGGAQQPLAAFRSRTHGAEAAIGYGKAAMVFFMLRDVIGEEAFARGIRHFWDAYRFRQASWSDLRSAFEAAAGRPLRDFFDQWVQRADAPKITVTEAQARTAAGKTALTVTLAQTGPPYALDIPLEIITAGRSETRHLRIERERQSVTLQLDYVPDGVRIDPDLRVWRVLDAQELPSILRQWIIARAPQLVIASSQPDVRAAAEALARRVFESPPKNASAAAISGSREPVLLAGLEQDIDALLVQLSLPPRPAAIAGRSGSAQIWTVERKAGSAPVAVVSARDAEALRALERALPHYGSESYLVFDGAQVIARGVWPAAAPIVQVKLDHP